VIDQAPYWLWRAVGGVMMVAGHLVFAFNVAVIVGWPQRLAPDLGPAGAPA
jgi:cbb3-type cytochrome oxidase subunit 1